MTVVEVMIVTGLTSLMLAGIWTFGSFSARSFAASGNYVDMASKGRNALDIMSRDIRRAVGLASYTINSLQLVDYDGAANLTFIYSPSNRTLTRTKGGISTVLLTECDSLTFNLYQRTPVGGTYEQFPAADQTTCKVIQVNWNCSRTIFGGKINTENSQTAKIVIRNK